MKARKGGLGRGLGALIPTGAPANAPVSAPAAPGASAAPGAEERAEVPTQAEGRRESTRATDSVPDVLAPVPGARFREVPVTAIVPNPKQPRQVFDTEALEELRTSISEVGFLQPIVVRETEDPGSYELVMGERRWRAAKEIGLDLIPAIIRDTRDDELLRDALLENIHRANLNPLEEAAAYQQLLDEFGATHEELARRIGRSRPQISNTIRLMNLPPAVQRRVAAGVLSAGHARALLSLEGPERQDQLAQRIVAEGLSVRATEELVALAGHEPEPKTGTPPRKSKAHAPGLTDLADKLSDRFDTRVKVDLGRRKGKITIEFGSVDDLERIVGLIGIGEQGSDGP